jgi:hypothetical protein
MNHYIVYQGNMGRFSWRKVDEHGETVRNDDGQPISSDITNPFRTQEEAKADVLAIDPGATVEMRPVAHFDETIDEAEEREELEGTQ